MHGSADCQSAHAEELELVVATTGFEVVVEVLHGSVELLYLDEDKTYLQLPQFPSDDELVLVFTDGLLEVVLEDQSDQT